MSFRLRIFVLVMVVAVTAIGATAWLTLSLTSREYERAQRDAVRHEQEFADEVQSFGLLRGGWPGVDVLVADLSGRYRLHVQLRTEDGVVLADSDTIAGRTAAPVQAAGIGIDPRPQLDPGIAAAAATPGADAPKALFTGSQSGSPATRMIRQAAEYRAALLAARCIADAQDELTEPLGLARAPYLSPEQLRDHPDCARDAETKVLRDVAWLRQLSTQWSSCAAATPTATCLYLTFTRGVTSFSAVPLQLYLGVQADTSTDALGRPALLGAAGLVLLAALGTALIARQISLPVRRLTDASRRLAGGHLDTRVPADGGSELARLSASFNAMAEAVQRSEERQRRLVADVAHELRTPLSNLRGYLEGLSDGVIEPSQELFASLHEETLLQRRILDDLQVLALAEAGDLQYHRVPADLAELVTTAATAHRAVAAEAGIELTVDAPQPVDAVADPDRLRQVLGNLLSNAVRYTDSGGTVSVRVFAAGADAVLTVRDTGVGMSADDVGRVFDRFWRADPARQRATGGTGLGLTIAHQIVTDHGGRIEVASQPHLGTTFTVRIPRRPG
ncbi:sensor histidine kinase [Symbioplanes lichenis]|uniref:sensor histidine kinase n=1 Tax=Symbioplanes lichenis TaxID=1629072 RepID=UPI002738D9C4|nr:ATP-binding protein [Actinoplanes lichenis]